ncbi:MAG: DinB family protein [Fimbriimonadaceae bacterium]
MSQVQPIHTLLKARLDYVRRDLFQTLAGMTDDRLDWRPGEGMRTVRGQLFEILGKEVELLNFAKGKGQAEWVEMDDPGSRLETLEDWKQALDGARSETLRYLDQMSEGDLNELLPFPEDDWWEGLCLEAIPMHEVFRNIAAHEWYHAGQITTYLWCLGKDPYHR